MRSRSAGTHDGIFMQAASGPELLEQPDLQLIGAQAARRLEETTQLTALHESAPTELDRLQPSSSGPPSDRLGLEMHVRPREDLARLGQGDPVVGRRGHVGQAPFAGDGGPAVEPEPATGVVVEAVDVSEPADVVLPLSFGAGFASPPVDDGVASATGSPAAFALAAVAVDERSFLAQPDPLKCTAGAVIALRSGRPQTGQVVGPSAVTEWITSIRWPFAQT